MFIKSFLLEQFPELIFGFSTKLGNERTVPFWFNLSNSVGDDAKNVSENRNYFFSKLGLNEKNVALQKQIHSDIVEVIVSPGLHSQSDALITATKEIGLAISSADCTPIFLYDKKNKVIAAIHSGWRGTQKKILAKVLAKLKSEFNTDFTDVFAYIGPSISMKHYEVGIEFESFFEEKYLSRVKEKLYLDIAKVNFDILCEHGVPDQNIQSSNLCSYEISYLQSYRRDKEISGRAFGVIAMKEKNG